VEFSSRRLGREVGRRPWPKKKGKPRYLHKQVARGNHAALRDVNSGKNSQRRSVLLEGGEIPAFGERDGMSGRSSDEMSILSRGK